MNSEGGGKSREGRIGDVWMLSNSLRRWLSPSFAVLNSGIDTLCEVTEKGEPSAVQTRLRAILEKY